MVDSKTELPSKKRDYSAKKTDASYSGKHEPLNDIVTRARAKSLFARSS